MSLKQAVYKLRKKIPTTTIEWILYVLLLIGGILTGIIIAFIISTFTDMEAIKPLETYSDYSVPTKVYDVNEELITEFFYERRTIISYRDLPASLINAIVATEDNQFFSHHGFNLVAMFQGVVIDPLMGRSMRGGSGISQQLSKQLFTDSERKISRKLKELWYTLQIEKKYSKEEILELYFNAIYFGHGCYGIESAANYYFDKSVSELDTGESAFLAGLPQAPSGYSPFLNPYKAQKRHRVVLSAMAREGYITEDEAEEIYLDFWGNYDETFAADGISANINTDNPAPYFTEYIRELLIDEYGEEELYSGGLSVYTTLDLDRQKIAREDMKEGLEDAQELYEEDFEYYSDLYKEKCQDSADLLSLFFGIDSITVGALKTQANVMEMAEDYYDLIYLSSFILGQDALNDTMSAHYLLENVVSAKQDEVQGALISINPTNGYIVAMVGGKEFSYANQFNRATQAQRPMGSSFKPIYYAMAIDNYLITPADVYSDKPIAYQNEAGALWTPRNYEGTFRGDIRIREALQYSVNVISVQVWDLLISRIGFTKMAQTIGNFFGLTEDEARERVDSAMAYSLGVGIFTPLEVARAFSVFANGGKSVEPIAILKVVDRYGRTLDDFELERELKADEEVQVISKASAFIMTDLLHSVLYYGTGSGAASRAGFYYDAGGKTGTSPNWKDAWFAGFTKNLCTVVWVGFDDSTRSLGRHHSAAKVAAPIWMEYMRDALEDDPPGTFSAPSGVISWEICTESGMSPGPYCQDTRYEYFLAGTVPIELCDVHTDDEMDLLDEYQVNSITDVNVNLWDDSDDVENAYDNFEDFDLFGDDIDLGLGLD